MDFDSIDEKTAFKLGFADRCRELGFSPAEVKEAMEKQAFLRRLLSGAATYIPKGAGKWLPRLGWGTLGLGSGVGLSGLWNATKDISGLGLGLAGGAGLLGGAALGAMKAKLDEEDVDEDAIKAKELADTYKTYAERLKAQKAYQAYRQQRGLSN